MPEPPIKTSLVRPAQAALLSLLLLTCSSLLAGELSFTPSGQTGTEPYVLEAPTARAPEGRSPLIVFLHGRGGDHRRQWLNPALDAFRHKAADRGYFTLSPHLGKAAWMNEGARRHLNELLDLTCRTQPIDRERIFLMGMSMGGGGALTYAIHHGERVRALCDIFGVTDFSQFYSSGRYQASLSAAFGGTPEDVPDVYRQHSAIANLDAFAKIPIFVLHGDKDTTVPTEHSRQFVKALMIPGYDVVYREVKGGTHRSELIAGYEHDILDFFDAVGGQGYDPRRAFARGRQNLALGKPYQYSAVPRYRLTHDDGDLTDLTDGRLSERRDERIWFERHCVAWHGDPGANIVVDLGAVHGIAGIAGRFLGGREQGGLRFPQQVDIAVSSDGVDYRRVGHYEKGVDDAAFGIPAEDGKAWVHALRFDALQARARFVAFIVQFDGSFCAADELFVFGSEHAEDEDRAGEHISRPVVFPFGPDRYTAYPLKGDWFVSDLETWTCIGGTNTLADRKASVTLILDLPSEVTLTKTMLNERYGGRPDPAPEPSTVMVEGMEYRRYEIPARGLSEKFWMYLFWTTEQAAGWQAPARIGSRWEGGEQTPVPVTVHAVAIPKAPRLSKRHVSLDWMGQSFWVRNATTVLDVLEHCGFTAMPYSGMWVKPDDTDLKQALEEAERRDLDIIYNFSPLHAVQGQKKEHPDVLCQLSGGKAGFLCPSSRGELLEQHLELIAERFAFHPAPWVFLDCEVHWSSLEQIGDCSRCRQQMTAGESAEDFAARMGRELFGMLREKLQAVCTAQGKPRFRMGSYAVHPSQTRYPVLRFAALYPDILDFAMPSIYTIRPDAVRERVCEDRKLLDADAVIPWLQPGTMGEKPAEALFQEALACLLSGGLGLTYYTHHSFDAADFAAVAQAVMIAQAYESLIADGTPVESWQDCPAEIAACGKRRGDEAIWMLSNLRAEPVEGALPRPATASSATVELTAALDGLRRTTVSGAVVLMPNTPRVFATTR